MVGPKSHLEIVNVCATYSLTAIPWPLSGENKGNLEYILFVATDGIQIHKWSSTNSGACMEELSRIVPPGNAIDIFSHLLRGEPVLFPGLFDLEQIRNKSCGVDSAWLPNSA